MAVFLEGKPIKLVGVLEGQFNTLGEVLHAAIPPDGKVRTFVTRWRQLSSPDRTSEKATFEAFRGNSFSRWPQGGLA